MSRHRDRCALTGAAYGSLWLLPFHFVVSGADCAGVEGPRLPGVAVNLIAPSGGEHRQPAYLAINPQGRVPALRTDDGALLIQSPAIIEYLEERYPQVPLLPDDLLARAQVRGVAAVIGCDVHPLHNVSVLNRLRQAGQNERRWWSGSAIGSAKGWQRWSS